MLNQLQLQRAIINFIDENDGATANAINNHFKDRTTFDVKGELVMMELEGEIRLIPLDRNLGTYKYHLPA